MKFVILMLSMGMFVSCAAKATTPSVQEQLTDHMRAVEADHTAMAEKNATQDARLSELEAKVDRAFRKGN